MKYLRWFCALLIIPPALAAEFNAPALKKIDLVIETAVAKKEIPGGVLWLEREGEIYRKAYGQRAVATKGEPASLDTIYDLASLTKVVAGTPAVMLLVERGKLSLDDPVSRHIPEFTGYGKEAVTIRHLLTHTSGLRGGIGTRPPWEGQDTAIRKACAEKLRFKPGTDFKYSDINFFVLGAVVQRVSGRPLEQFVGAEIYEPLKMVDTRYLPPKEWGPRIAPTTKTDGDYRRGLVHDPTARCMGGVAGHAGLFSPASDLARYARMLLNEGELEGIRIFKPETVRMMTSVQTPPAWKTKRGFGWDIDSAYSRLRGEHSSVGSFGHTGYTGTSIWIDPASKTFWIFLSNRVHPDGKGTVRDLRAMLGNLAGEAVQ